MARVETVIDDLTGDTLSEDVEPTTITFDGKEYSLDLGEASKNRLVRWLNGEDSLTPARRSTAPTKRAGSSNSNAERNAKIRHWAIETGYEYENAKGEKVTLGERGRIPAEVVKAWEDAGSPDIS